MTLTIKNYYLESPMPNKQFLPTHHSMIPQEIMYKYDLVIEDNGNVYMMICKRMYNLKESGILAITSLVKNMAPYGYFPMKYTPVLLRQNTRKLTFTLCVDDSGKNTSRKTMRIILSTTSKPTTKSPSTVPAASTSASTYTGTT